MISVTEHPRPEQGRRRRWWQRRPPKILAIFSYRYDQHLVPALIDNIRPMVDGWVALDDRDNPAPFSSDTTRRIPLLEAAHAAGADWVLAVDPDERYESRLVQEMPILTGSKLPIVWSFRLREMYTPDSYRTDGIWGRKRQARLFPLFDDLFPAARSGLFARKDFHARWYPRGYAHRRTDLDLYHLKMIDPARRAHRRDVYKTIDPDNRYQAVGYDYLGDDTQCVLETIPRGRGYHPPHLDDGRLWMVGIDSLRDGARANA